ncbi:dihydrofolate reductase [Zooshikella harenae]|uniref:Dihydrofolate reductase n=1 Tax=Zooshikella harenae TaxID=2827238 RepID=A0ABS5Z9C9_9GAMM|nr:dihydrofolate reductase [Zooshikella harenae]MBU2710661.1 dihydrofolate reductase [Zooshikella harenae]
MQVAMIAALAANRVIGVNGKLPWYIPGELKYFKHVTMGKPIIMGRKTFVSLGRPLPGRSNIVITRDQEYQHEGVQVVHSVEEALTLAENIAYINGADEVVIIGGGEIYRQALPKATRLYLTQIHKDYEGDAVFPEWSKDKWQMVSEQANHYELQALDYSYQVWQRTASDGTST